MICTLLGILLWLGSHVLLGWLGAKLSEHYGYAPQTVEWYAAVASALIFHVPGLLVLWAVLFAFGKREP